MVFFPYGNETLLPICQQNVHLTDCVASALKGRVMLFYVKHSSHAVRVTKGVRYTIVTFYDIDDVEATAA